MGGESGVGVDFCRHLIWENSVNEVTGTQASVRPDSVIVRDSEPIFTTIDDEVVMLSPRAQAYFGLGMVGSEIWNAIEKPRRVDELCAAAGIRDRRRHLPTRGPGISQRSGRTR